MACEQGDGFLDRVVTTSIDRRSLIVRGAAVSAGGLATAGFGSCALAAVTGNGVDHRLNIFEGGFAINGGAVVDGYFATPRAERGALDIVVVVHGENGLDARARSTANRIALGGKLAVAPNLPTTWGKDTAGLGHDARIARLLAHVPDLKRLPRGSGRITVVAAA